MEGEARAPGMQGVGEDAAHLVGRGVAGGVADGDFDALIQRHRAFDPFQRIALGDHALEGAVEAAGEVEAHGEAFGQRLVRDGREVGEAALARAVHVGLVVAFGDRHEQPDAVRAVFERRLEPTPVRHQRGAFQAREHLGGGQHLGGIGHLRNGFRRHEGPDLHPPQPGFVQGGDEGDLRLGRQEGPDRLQAVPRGHFADGDAVGHGGSCRS